MRKPATPNAVLLAIIAVLGLLLLARTDSGSALSAAGAAQPDPGQPVTQAPFNATEQRRQMIVQLEQINRRLANLEAKLQSGIAVTVKEMPAVKIAEDARQK
jgi:hypothetical protein